MKGYMTRNLIISSRNTAFRSQFNDLVPQKKFRGPQKGMGGVLEQQHNNNFGQFLSVALPQIDQFGLFELIEGISEHKTPENDPKTHHAMIYDHFPAIHRGNAHNSHRNVSKPLKSTSQRIDVEHPKKTVYSIFFTDIKYISRIRVSPKIRQRHMKAVI